MLEAIEVVIGELPLGDSSQTVISLDKFAVSLQAVNSTGFNGTRILSKTDNVEMPIIDIDEFFLNSNLSISDHNYSAEIIIPENIFEFASSTSNLIASAVYVDDTLFLRRDKKQKEVASVILSATLVGSNSISGLNDSTIQLIFRRNTSVSDSNFCVGSINLICC